MLYDPKWERKTETKADPLKMETLIAWLEKQPAHKEYDYYNCRGRCLLGQYMAAHGLRWMDDYKYDALPWPMRKAAIADGADMPRTFGAALKRARKIHAAA